MQLYDETLADTDYDEKSVMLADAAVFLRASNTILIPRKTAAAVKYIPDSVLVTVHADVEVAREMCLYFLSMMTRAYFDEHKRVHLHSQVLKRLFRPLTHKLSTDTCVYVEIRKALLHGTSRTGAIIGFSNEYAQGEQTKSYWLTAAYDKTGFLKYEVKTSHVLGLVRRNYYERLAQAAENPIARNLFRFYATVQLPTSEEAATLGAQLAKAKAKTKKGKTLTMRHRKDRSYWKDADTRSFVEDSLELYAFLTEEGMMTPIIGGERSGGRVYDSISLMPSWIRAAITVDGQPVVELDYKALHPNLAMKIYGGSSRFITHSQVATETAIPRDWVKVEHLSFFNKRWEGIERSPLYGYYCTKEPALMETMCRDKAADGHTTTSRKMFALEVALITKVIERLNALGIYAGYAYDALYVAQEHAELTANMMNSVALEMEIYTATVEVDNFEAHKAQLAAAFADDSTQAENLLSTPSIDDDLPVLQVDDVLPPAVNEQVRFAFENDDAGFDDSLEFSLENDYSTYHD